VTWNTYNASGALKTSAPEKVQPNARAFHNVAQSIPNATNTVVALNSERWDSGGVHDNVTNNSRLTATEAGVYVITGAIQFAPNATGFRGVLLRVNGSTFIASNEMLVIDGVNNMEINTQSIWRFNVNEYVEMLVVQNSGGALNLNSTSSFTPEFAMVRVGP